ncbi:MAG: glycoside hydrolase family 2 TIM barrel-domain containing protein [Balneolaceae bacterium]
MSKTCKTEFSRKSFLKTALAGAGGIATWSVLGSCSGGSFVRGKRGPAAHSIPFNTNWWFGEATENSSNINFDDSRFEEITLPHTVTDLSWREWDPATWEKVWMYRRKFELGEDLSQKRAFIDFGAAMTAAKVFLNGKEIGENIGGYLPFSFELTDHLSDDGENVLAVELDSRFNINTPPNRPGKKTTVIDFWQPGGIYQIANLRIVPEIFISDVFAKPINVLSENPQLDVEFTVDAAVMPKGSANLNVELMDGDELVNSASATVNISKTGQTTASVTLENLEDIRLWDLDDPNLYDVVATLVIDDNAVHNYRVRTGFRKAEFTKSGFYLNGERVQIFGLNRHHTYPFAGGAMPARVHRKDAEILKNDLNCNMVRCSHYPQLVEFFDACDELGLMAFEEIAGWGMWLGDEVWKERVVRDVDLMVRRDRNHPSIVIWGTRMNETPDDIELNTTTRDTAHKLDNSRQTTGSIGGWDHATKNFVQDVFSLNDYTSSTDENGLKWPGLHPPRQDFPYLVSEAVGTLSGPSKHYRHIDSAYMQQGQAESHAIVHDITASDEGYSGLVAWSGYDYPSGNGNQFGGVKYTGVIDLFRVPKLGAAIYKSNIDPEVRPVIAPAFFWDFSPKSLPFEEGRMAMICSNCERLELFVDDEHYTTVYPDTEKFPHLKYPPSFVNLNDIDGSSNPELRIQGYLGDEQVINYSFSSDRNEDEFYMEPDNKEITADGSDATRVVFRILDKYGAPRPYIKGDITFALDGPATLIGDNPFAFEDTGGVGAVWLRSLPGRIGNIQLKAEHPEFGERSIEISATKS